MAEELTEFRFPAPRILSFKVGSPVNSSHLGLNVFLLFSCIFLSPFSFDFLISFFNFSPYLCACALLAFIIKERNDLDLLQEGSSLARYFVSRLIPAHKDPPYEQVNYLECENWADSEQNSW